MNPVDDLADTLRAILDGHPRSRIEDVVPWRYQEQPSSLAAWGLDVALTAHSTGQTVTPTGEIRHT